MNIDDVSQNVLLYPRCNDSDIISSFSLLITIEQTIIKEVIISWRGKLKHHILSKIQNDKLI